MACEQVGVVGMQSQAQVVQPMEVLLLAITPTAHPPRWVLQEQQPPPMPASSVDKQDIGHVIAQVSTFAHVVLHIVASAAASCITMCLMRLQHHSIDNSICSLAAAIMYLQNVCITCYSICSLAAAIMYLQNVCITCYSPYMAADSVTHVVGKTATD